MFRSKLRALNWKYILGEVLLIFLGINLAIWFNDWNADRNLNEDKKIAIAKIEEEIRNNLTELIDARKENEHLPSAIAGIKAMHSDLHNGILATPEELAKYQREHPGFFTTADSAEIRDDKYLYEGDTYINLELAELTEIAWETTKDMGIANEFGFDCLYELENMYNVQRLVQKEYTKSAEALQNNDIERLLRVLVFIEQLDSQLERDYKRTLDQIEICQ